MCYKMLSTPLKKFAVGMAKGLNDLSNGGSKTLNQSICIANQLAYLLGTFLWRLWVNFDGVN